MDVAYDHIQEEILASNDTNNNNNNEDNKSSNNNAGASFSDASAESSQRNNLDLSAEFQETFRAFSSNPWGARLGGLWGNVRKQGETYYQGARQEYEAASEEAIKGFSDLRESIVGRTRGLSLGTALGGGGGGEGEGDAKSKDKGKEKENDDGEAATPTADNKDKAGGEADGEGFISRFRTEAAKRLKDIEKAEDAADEALLRFGTNIRNFLRDAVSIAPPEGAEENNNKVLFESKDADGKRVIHTTRFEAQLHAIHSNLDRLSQDPVSGEWPKWKSEFKVDAKTDEIAADLERYPELRRAMEALVPEKVEYGDFWSRYYFLRMVVETEEKRRKEMLKGASTADDEEVAWDEDSDSDSESPATPQVTVDKTKAAGADSSSSSTQEMSSSRLSAGNETLKATESRRSNDQQSQADSDASYDLVSGAPSRAPNSPKEGEKAASGAASAAKADDSDEEDWE
ncbi:hypothetical protein AJ79_08597 [Helicocarpus griseus UAMH5409]|uniref:BSD domain-containing protein n=1 Tax=Helicocarpus griseus UAMH5409 TaxID=1447875 RepID=A0A2B7WRY7_9EURO|nr:hypothetical protein AJ79_08597 [Helicocarpus griseus UAMH5409]